MGTATFDERIPALRHAPGTVNREEHIVFGARLIQLGDLNEGDVREQYVDDETLSQALGFASGPSKGLKARFTHPNMSSDGLGRYLGRWKDARIEGDSLVADLHIAPVAFASPDGNLGDWVEDMAENDPDVFGVSIAPSSLDYEAMSEERREDGKEPIRLNGLRAADVVDDPAATRGGLFSTDSAVAIPAQVTYLLNSHFAETDPVEVARRAVGLLGKHYGRNLMAELLDNQTDSVDLSTEGDEELVLEVSDSIDLSTVQEAAKPFVEAFGSDGAQAFLEGKTLLECYVEQASQLAGLLGELETENEDLRSRLEAAVLASGEPEELSGSIEPQAEISEARKKLLARREEMEAKGADPVVAKFGAALSR